MNSLGRSRCNANAISILKKNGGATNNRRRRLVHTTPSTPQFMRQSDVYISSRWSNGTSIIRRQQHQSYHHLQNHSVRGAGGSSKTASATGASCKTNRDSYYFKAKRMHSSIMLRQTLFQQQQQQASSSRPSNAQLKHLFFVSAVPMIGFGFMDNIIMIEAGSYIDTTLGVKLGISTLMAAALGQVVSDLSGVLFGGVVERSMMSLGMLKPASHLSPLTVAQRSLPIVKNVTMAGSAVGVVVGCLLGASTLLLHNKEDHHDRDDVAAHNNAFTMNTVQEMIQLHSLEDIKKVYWIQVEGDTFNTSNETLANAVKEGKSIVQEQYETSSEVLYVPIKHNKSGTVVGVVTFEKFTGHTFDTQEMKMVNLLSKQVAVVMDHGER